MEEGLNLMRRVHLVDSHVTERGIVYQAREEASAFADSLRSDYARALKDRASWLVLLSQEIESQGRGLF